MEDDLITPVFDKILEIDRGITRVMSRPSKDDSLSVGGYGLSPNVTPARSAEESFAIVPDNLIQ
jgi:hypothetical protein